MIQYIGPKGHNMPVANGNNWSRELLYRMAQQAEAGKKREQEKAKASK